MTLYLKKFPFYFNGPSKSSANNSKHYYFSFNGAAARAATFWSPLFPGQSESVLHFPGRNIWFLLVDCSALSGSQWWQEFGKSRLDCRQLVSHSPHSKGNRRNLPIKIYKKNCTILHSLPARTTLYYWRTNSGNFKLS